MTMVCVLTGYGRVFTCKDTSTEEALRVIRQMVALYGRCLEVRTDSGPGFRSAFQEGLKTMGIISTTPRHIHLNQIPMLNGLYAVVKI